MSAAGARGVPAGVYLHFPFCAAKCGYCDFASIAGRDDRIAPYLDALEREILDFQPGAPSVADTLYFGGGTPSRMTAAQVGRLVRAVRERFDLESGAEISLEANPESLSATKLEGYREAGVDRVSVGIQSLDDRVLAAAGRLHDARGGKDAVALARGAGLRSVALDLIAGLPGEDLDSWGRTVREAAALGPDHVSVYLLETDKDTPLARALRAGTTDAPDDDAVAAAYETTVAALEEAGLAGYEISNFARPGHESRHNLKYWTDAPYVGFGAGAHGYYRGERRANVKEVDLYVERIGAGEDPVASREGYDAGRRVREALILGLRTASGVDLDVLSAAYGIDLAGEFRESWERAEGAGVLERRGARATLTSFGRLRCNELFAELI